MKALRGVSLTVKKGDFLIITGRNGSGKSTLMHQLGLLDSPEDGHIYLSGREVTGMREKERSEIRLRDLGYIFQEFALIDELTALENVMLPTMMIEKTEICREKALAMLAQVGLGPEFVRRAVDRPETHRLAGLAVDELAAFCGDETAVAGHLLIEEPQVHQR